MKRYRPIQNTAIPKQVLGGVAGFGRLAYGMSLVKGVSDSKK